MIPYSPSVFLQKLNIQGCPGERSIATNASGSRIACVDSHHRQVRIHHLDLTSSSCPKCVRNFIGVSYRFFNPHDACFVTREGVDTLLVTDARAGYPLIVELTDEGSFIRCFPYPRGAAPGYASAFHGIAYRDGVIAVSVHIVSSVLLIDYSTGGLRQIIRSPQISIPSSLSFTDESTLLIANSEGGCVNEISLPPGASERCVVRVAEGRPFSAVPYGAAGDVLVSSEYGVYSVSGSGAVDEWLVYGSSDGYLLSPTSYGVIMMDRSDGRLLLLRRWEDGSRCAWISACVT
jgi:hypothetical protein